MCGIAGFLDSRAGIALDRLASLATRMADSLEHRGPDDRGVWADPQCGVALAHRRLSILDLSPAGHQPMHSANGRYVMVFNGEIFNHGEMRDRLKSDSVAFRGHSDTEVLLEAIARWGLEEAVRQSVGMFALALWDRVGRTFALVRDRLGIKPLYYGLSEGRLFFASELKALRAHPSFVPSIDRDALALFTQYGYVPAPLSIYQGIRKLLPGSMLVISAGHDLRPSDPRPYWSLEQVVAQGQSAPLDVADDEAEDSLDELLRQAVRMRMEADVPLGAFLSGGIDSSVVVALMQSQSIEPVRTFTIGFDEVAYDEAPYARRIADRLGTQHVECYVTSQDARDVIPSLPRIYDEPFADSSQIPTLLVSRIARQHVTVSLSGDGGDELFAGYSRYAFSRSFWRRFGWLPRPVRRGAASLLRTTGPHFPTRIARKARTLSILMSQRSAAAMYEYLNTHWKPTDELVLETRASRALQHCWEQAPALPSMTQSMMYADTMMYLPDDILTKVDRASMSVGLEARVPLLDHRVVEWAWRLPLSLKVRHGQTKWILRRVLERYVPRHLFERPKVGFGVPIDSWLRGPLRDWAEELLGERRLKRDGFFRAEPIREKWREHLSGQTNWHYHLWDILMFQAWLDCETAGWPSRPSPRDV